MITEVEQTHHLKRQRKSSYAVRFSFFVLLPTLVAAIYYFFIASDQYVSEIKFSVNVEQEATAAQNILSGIMPSIGSSRANIQEPMLVKEFITSSDMMDKLQQTIGLAKIYTSRSPDFLSYPPSPTDKEAMNDYYKDMTTISLDEASGIVSLQVKAFQAQDAKKIADSIMEIAEEFVNSMSSRMQEDSIRFSREEVIKAEKELLYASMQMMQFRNENENFDPETTTVQVLEITSKLEGELAKTQTEIDSLSNYLKSNSPKIKSLKAKAGALRSQISSQGSRLASTEGSALADMLQSYQELKLRHEFALKKYELALASFESAKTTALKKNKYLLRIVGPTTPSESTEPQRILQVLTIFFVCFIGYSVISLLIESIKDHIRP